MQNLNAPINVVYCCLSHTTTVCLAKINLRQMKARLKSKVPKPQRGKENHVEMRTQITRQPGELLMLRIGKRNLSK